MTTTPPMSEQKHRALRRALRKARWAIRLSPRERAVMRRHVRDRAAQGGRPWFAEGALIVHLALDPFSSASICLRETYGTSTAPPRTLLGITCRRCVAIWNRGVAESKAEADLDEEVDR